MTRSAAVLLFALVSCARSTAPSTPEAETGALKLDVPGFFAEGLAWDREHQRLLLGGIVGQSIAAVSLPGGAVETFATPPETWSVFGVAVDAWSHIAWAACSAVPQGEVLPQPVGPAAIVGFGLRDGEVVTVAKLDDGEPHLFGDVTVSSGTAFVTDTLGGGVYFATRETTMLGEAVAPGTFRSPQGLVIHGDAIIVSDYPQGLFRVDRKAGAVHPLPAPGVDLRGIDGLALRGRSIAAVQNGAQPPRVLRLELAPDGRSIESADVLVVPDPAAGEPTLATFVGDALWVMQTDEWPRVFDQDGRPKTGVEVAPPTVLRVPWPASGG